jgi:sugar phosphate isomerase/epimerase
MAGADLPVALDRFVSLGLRFVDLKDRIWERKVEDLDDRQLASVERLLRERGLAVHCVSTSLGAMKIDEGEIAWRRTQADVLQRVLNVAAVVRPRYIRILGIQFTGARPHLPPTFDEALAAHPWMPSAYGEIMRAIDAAGYFACLENEARHCALATPDDVVKFFAALRILLADVPCSYVWDVQNMWQMGSFPSLAGYAAVRPFTEILHLKGGRADASGRLHEACGLREASWPVVPLLTEICGDGKVEMICLNPSHGRRPASFDIWQVVQDDIEFLREHVPVLGYQPNVLR